MGNNSAVDPDQQEYQEYLDYQDYQKYLAQHAGPSEKTGMGQAFLEHLQNGTALGHAPQIGAGAMAGITKLSDLIHGIPAYETKDNYVNNRDEIIARQAQESKEHPYASGAGSLIGIIGSTLALPGSGAMKGLDAGEKLARAIAMGGGMGAAMNPGDTEGAVDPIQGGDRATNAMTGGLLSLALSGFLSRGGESAKNAADAVQNRAYENAWTATGAGKTASKAAEKGPGMAEIGKTLLDEKVVPWLGTPNKIASNLENSLDTHEDKLKDILKNVVDKIHDPQFIESLGPDQIKALEASDMRPADMAAKAKQVFLDKYSEMPKEEIQPALDKIDTFFGSKGPILPIDRAQSMKVQLNNFLKDSDYLRQPGMAKQGLLSVQGGLRRGIEDNADALADILGQEGGQVKQTNATLGNLIRAKDAADAKVAANAVNRAIGLTDTIAGGTGATVGANLAGPAGAKAGAVIGTAGNKFMRTFGDSLASNAQNDILAPFLRGASTASDAASNMPAIYRLLVQKVLEQQGNPAGHSEMMPPSRGLGSGH